jgi:hypothetical protein
VSDVFVSYASEDRERVAPLVARLERLGVSLWWDREIAHGQNYHRVIQEALDQAQCAVVVWSANSIQSEWVVNEASSARKRNALVPVLIDAVEPPLEFRHLQSADLRADNPANEAEFEKFARSVRSLAGHAKAPPTRTSTDTRESSAAPRARIAPAMAIGVGVLLAGLAALLLVLKQIGWIGAPAPAQAPAAQSARVPESPPSSAASAQSEAAPPAQSQTASEPAPVPQAVAKLDERINVLLPENGAQLIAASEEGWRPVLESQEPTCRIISGATFALIALRNQQGARIDTLAVHVDAQNSYNLKQLELLGADTESGPFRRLAQFEIPNYRNMRAPFHEIKFEAANVKFVKLHVAGFQHGEGPNGNVCSIRLYEAR